MKKVPPCPVCHDTRHMKRFMVEGEEAWKCVNVKVHDLKAYKGGKGTGRPEEK